MWIKCKRKVSTLAQISIKKSIDDFYPIKKWQNIKWRNIKRVRYLMNNKMNILSWVIDNFTNFTFIKKNLKKSSHYDSYSINFHIFWCRKVKGAYNNQLALRRGTHFVVVSLQRRDEDSDVQLANWQSRLWCENQQLLAKVVA